MRNPEYEIDLSIFEEMDEQEALNYVRGKYSEEVADAMKNQIEKIVRKDT